MDHIGLDVWTRGFGSCEDLSRDGEDSVAIRFQRVSHQNSIDVVLGILRIMEV